MNANKPAARPLCPECECNGQQIKLRWRWGGNLCVTIWPIYSRHDFWTCPECKEKFVTYGEDCHGAELAAPGW